MVVGIGGNGVGQVLVAVAAAFLVRFISGPEPALPPEHEIELEDGEKEDGDVQVDEEEAPASGKVTPVTIRWRNISCSLSDKSAKSVSFLLFSSFLKSLVVLENAAPELNSGVSVSFHHYGFSLEGKKLVPYIMIFDSHKFVGLSLFVSCKCISASLPLFSSRV